MKTEFAGLLILVGAIVCFGQLSGPLSVTLGPGTFLVIDTIYVNPEDSLVLLPGTTFTFDGPFPFEIRGILLAQGVEGDSIIFTTDIITNPSRWRGLRFLDSTSSGSSLAYCVIENGHATGSYPYNCGGGVSLLISSPEFQHCSIRLNAADSLGGGVYCGSASSPLFTNCTIIGDTVGIEGFYQGGGCGVYCDSSSPTFSYCAINNNSTHDEWGGQSGGGIYSNECVVTLDHCSISYNNAGGIVGGPGGGIYCLNSSLILTECTISHNNAAWSGGGIALEGSTASLTGCTISENDAGDDSWSSRGGGVSCEASSASFLSCTIQGNSIWGNGGGIYCYNSSPTFASCNVTANFAGTGGAVCLEASAPMFSNCQIGGNRADGSAGGVFSSNSSPIFTGCTITGNIAQFGGAGGVDLVGPAAGTFTNCTIAGNSAFGRAGGVYCHDCSPSFTNCNISNNAAQSSSLHSSLGGGVYCSGPAAAPAFANCSINGNVSDSSGGGVACEGGALASFSDCAINGNSATYGGGGVYCHGASPILDDCTIDANTASFGGGACCRFNSSPRFSVCVISNNSVQGDGGGVACYDSSSPTMENCSILDNGAGFFGGGVICLSNSSPYLTSCMISRNHCGQMDWAGGGGAYCGSGSPTFVRCNISDNSAFGEGGGIDCSRSSATFTDCRINNNFACIQGGGILCQDHPAPSFRGCEIAHNVGGDGGGGILGAYCAPIITNCTIVCNFAYQAGGVFCYNSSFIINSTTIAFSDGEGIYFENGSESQVRYCDIFGNSGGDIAFWDNDSSNGPNGLGQLVTTNRNGDSCDVYYNIFLEPIFVDTFANDYHLQEDSPCIDAGDPDLPFDPDSTIADIGAFYYHQVDAQVPLIALPASYALYPNWPNPFNPVTTIRYDVKQSDPVRLTVFNLLGQRVAVLADGRHAAGSFNLSWDAANLPSGTYLCRMEARDFMQTRKLVLVK